MNFTEQYLKKNIDKKIYDFIIDHIDSFEKLDIIKYFGLNPYSKIDMKTLEDITDCKKDKMIRAIKELTGGNIIKEVIQKKEILYKLSEDANILECVKRFSSYYGNKSARLIILGYLLSKSIEKK